MTEPVALEDIKVHLRLDAGATDEDAYLESLITAARRALELRTGRPIVDDDPEVEIMEGDDLVAACHAIRLIVGNWYEFRESSTTEARSEPRQIPHTLDWLIEPLVKWDDGE